MSEAAVFGQVLEANPDHDKSLQHRAECHARVTDYNSAIADFNTLKAKSTTADAATRQAWSKRVQELKLKLQASPHQTLSIQFGASEAEIRKAYKQACLQHHPDKQAASSEDARERAKHMFDRIQEAYEKLTAQSTPRRTNFRNNW